MFKILSFCVVMLVTATGVLAQDIHFSHIHASPVHLNPAMTGVFNGGTRLIANFKNQWRGVPANYTTFGASADFKLVNTESGFLALGISGYGDKAGDLGYSSNVGNLSLGYALSLGDYNFISVGIQGGVLHNSIDYSKLDVFDIEPTITSGAPDNNLTYDAAAGISWNYTNEDDGFGAYLGGAVHHINQPDVAMLGQSLGYAELLHRKYVIHAGALLRLNDNSSLLPSGIFFNQGPHREVNTGAYYRYELSKRYYSREKSNYLYFGLWYRWHTALAYGSGSDAIIASVRADIKNLYLTFSYDITISTLSTANSGNGGPELSIVYIIPGNERKGKNKGIFCPRF